MKLAILSDLHFGDPACALVTRSGEGEYQVSAKYGELKEVVGRDNDFLVLLGDIFDFSVSDYRDAYLAARAFFQAAKHDELTRQFVYLPGNHDFAFWAITLHEINVINRIKRFQEPLSRWSIPGVIDDRPRSARRGLSLPNVTAQEVAKGAPRYGGLFLDALCLGPEDPPDAGPVFNVAYPNLYLVTGEGCTLLTHGQYFEPYWSLAGELGRSIAGADLALHGGAAMDIEDYVSINFPLNELASSGVGQAGPLTALVRTIQKEVGAGDLKRVRGYLDRAVKLLDGRLSFPWYRQVNEWVTDFGIRKFKEMIVEALGQVSRTRFDQEFMEKPEVQERFRAFYRASALEIGQLNRQDPILRLPVVDRVVFGHTHQAIPIDAAAPLGVLLQRSGRRVTLFNTGGWLRPDNPAPDGKVGGAVFGYTTRGGFTTTVL